MGVNYDPCRAYAEEEVLSLCNLTTILPLTKNHFVIPKKDVCKFVYMQFYIYLCGEI